MRPKSMMPKTSSSNTGTTMANSTVAVPRSRRRGSRRRLTAPSPTRRGGQEPESAGDLESRARVTEDLVDLPTEGEDQRGHDGDDADEDEGVLDRGHAVVAVAHGEHRLELAVQVEHE